MTGKIDINLYNGLKGRLETAEKALEEKDRLLIEYVNKYYDMKDTVKRLEAELAELKARKTA